MNDHDDQTDETIVRLPQTDETTQPLTVNQCQPLTQAERAKAEAEADEYVMWGAGRAAAIALMPLPLADIVPLQINETYMIQRIGKAYGYKVTESALAMLMGMMGASLAGKLFASFLPFLKVPIAAGVTYAVGRTAKAYFASGMTLSKDLLQQEFDFARKEADRINWKEHTIEED
ncbi:MAG: DUF697 domain-containing protein [Oligosphaeraceae bacterium]